MGFSDTIFNATSSHFKYLKGRGINGSNALYFKCDPANGASYPGTSWEHFLGAQRNIKVKRNTKYAASIWVKYANASNNNWNAFFCEAHAKSSETDTSRPYDYAVENQYINNPINEWTRVEFKFTTGNYDYLGLNIITSNSGGVNEMWLCQPKLEEGDGATPWCIS